MPNGNPLMGRAKKAARQIRYKRLLAAGYTPETARDIIRHRNEVPNLNRKESSGVPVVPPVPFGASQGDGAKRKRRIRKRKKGRDQARRNNPGNPGNPEDRSGSCSGGCGD